MGSQDHSTANHGMAGADSPAGARVQFGALCWRLSDAAVEILLITSRDTGRWIIPKGWPMPGLAPEAAAAQEAWEEAGAEGIVTPVCIGRYGYLKRRTATETVPCAVAVFGLQVRRLADQFPEAGTRQRAWFTQEDAAGMVQEPDLARLIADFVPPRVGRHAPITDEAAG